MADVSSFYPNIGTKKAIIALDILLREGKVAQTPLLVQLTRLLIFEKGNKVHENYALYRLNKLKPFLCFLAKNRSKKDELFSKKFAFSLLAFSAYICSFSTYI